jgi:prophage tail gpP-like protein
MHANELSMIVAQRKISGWTAIRVTRGVERCPSDFDIEMTERFPGEAQAAIMQPGDPCMVLLGDDVVVTGYIDRVVPTITPDGHSVRVVGRGKCQDLVDCAAIWPGAQLTNLSALQIAQNLSAVYGISVTADVDVGGPIPQKNLIQGETPYELIERIARFRGLLVYELPDGNLFMTRAGDTRAASGFKQGVNIIAASIEYSMDGRYSEYVAYMQSVDFYGDIGTGGNQLSTAYDAGVPRRRRMVLIAEAGGGGLGIDICKQRAVWEANRRYGRAHKLTLTTDSWRDSAGNLWEPNTVVPLDIPLLKLPDFNWVIGNVSYRRDDEGTTAELEIMPDIAYLAEPIVLQPFQADIPALAP